MGLRRQLVAGDITTELRSLVPAVGEHLGDPVTQVFLQISGWRSPGPNA